MKYKCLKNTFKPTFWVSAYFNQGIKVMNESTLTKSTGIEEITGSGSVNSGTFAFIKDNNIGLKLSGAHRILSTSKYQNYYKYILIMKKDLNSGGRLFNNSSENQLFGFWGIYVGSIWLNADVNLR